jgi:hypothetical protein
MKGKQMTGIAWLIFGSTFVGLVFYMIELQPKETPKEDDQVKIILHDMTVRLVALEDKPKVQEVKIVDPLQINITEHIIPPIPPQISGKRLLKRAGIAK